MSATAPVWLLIGDKAGDNAQLRALAAEAGLAAAEKRPPLNSWSALPNVLLGSSGMSLAGAGELAPPWPRLILASGRKNAAVALWIKRRSLGRAKLVHVGRPWAPLSWFDLVLTQPQYQLPSHANVLNCALPFNRVAPARLQAEAQRWAPVWSNLPRPWLGLIVGGTARPLELDAATAAAIGRRAATLARALGGTLLISTSRRTPQASADALIGAVDAPSFVFRWRADARPEDNPYAAILALADRLIVTGDSASMVAEAVRSGKMVSVAPLPARRDWRRRVADGLRGVLPARMFAGLIGLGLVTSTRDVGRLLRPLLDAGIVAALETGEPPRAAFIDDLPQAAARVRALLAS